MRILTESGTQERGTILKWRRYARDLGFKNEREMWQTLIQEWSLGALGDLLGYSAECIMERIQKKNIINPHGRGGRNNVGKRVDGTQHNHSGGVCSIGRFAVHSW